MNKIIKYIGVIILTLIIVSCSIQREGFPLSIDREEIQKEFYWFQNTFVDIKNDTVFKIESSVFFQINDTVIRADALNDSTVMVNAFFIEEELYKINTPIKLAKPHYNNFINEKSYYKYAGYRVICHGFANLKYTKKNLTRYSTPSSVCWSAVTFDSINESPIHNACLDLYRKSKESIYVKILPNYSYPDSAEFMKLDFILDSLKKDYNARGLYVQVDPVRKGNQFARSNLDINFLFKKKRYKYIDFPKGAF